MHELLTRHGCRYDAPLSPEAAWLEASKNLEYRSQSKDGKHFDSLNTCNQNIHDELAALIDTYLNGPRTLSNDRLSYLIINSEYTNKNLFTNHSQDTIENYDFMICATHFLGDGMALHQFANDFFVLLGSCGDENALLDRLTAEWSEKCANTFAKVVPGLYFGLKEINAY